MKKLIYLLVSCMLFSLAACNDDKEDNGGSIIGLWKVTKFEGQVFGDEDISGLQIHIQIPAAAADCHCGAQIQRQIDGIQMGHHTVAENALQTVTVGA